MGSPPNARSREILRRLPGVESGRAALLQSRLEVEGEEVEASRDVLEGGAVTK